MNITSDAIVSFDTPVSFLTVGQLMQLFISELEKHNSAMQARKERDTMNLSELALYLGVAEETIYQYVHKGMPHSKNGKFLSFKKEEVDNWAKGRRTRRFKKSKTPQS